MHIGSFVFTQIVDFIPRHSFDLCVKRYAGDYKVRELPCREQFLALLFGQLTHLESLRDIVTCLEAQKGKLYHLGFSKPVARSTLARANKNRDWRIYRDFASILIAKARKLYADTRNSVDGVDMPVYALDASVIDLCPAWFEWATFRKHKAGIKLHVVLDLNGLIPTVVYVTEARVHEVNIMDRIDWEHGSLYLMDRGYTDFARLYRINTSGTDFIIRAKRNLDFRRLYSWSTDPRTGVRCNQVIKLNGLKASQDYPEKLRRVKYFDHETSRYYVFLTNNFELSALQIAQLYKHRWQVELFFKWIKQHVKVQVFWGHTRNAVKTQICAAMCAYVLVAILKKQLFVNREMHQLLQILRVSMFDRIGLTELFSSDLSSTYTTVSSEQGVFIGF